MCEMKHDAMEVVRRQNVTSRALVGVIVVTFAICPTMSRSRLSNDVTFTLVQRCHVHACPTKQTSMIASHFAIKFVAEPVS